MEPFSACIERIRKTVIQFYRFMDQLNLSFLQKDSKITPEKLMKLLEAMYFCSNALRNNISGAIEYLQLLAQLKDSSFPGTWADETLFCSDAEILENGIILIRIPEDLPKFSKELNLSCRKRWQGYIYHALKKLKMNHGILPYYGNAMIVIEVHSPSGVSGIYKWDVSNRTYNIIINDLKGLVFPDDNAINLIFAVAGVYDSDRQTLLYIGDFERHRNAIMQNLIKTRQQNNEKKAENTGNQGNP